MKTIPLCVSVVLTIAMAFGSCGNNRPEAEDTLVDVEKLPSCSNEFLGFADFVNKNQFGLSVQNLYHPNILKFAAKEAPWKPVNGLKATVGGRLNEYFITTKNDAVKEFDWCLKVSPNAPFIPFLKEGDIQGEVTPPLQLRDDEFFTPVGEGQRPLLGKEICMYGAWVLDSGSKDQREIHPAEAIWFQNNPGDNSDVHLFLIQDATVKRFTEFSNYDFDEDDDGHDEFQPGWAPWVTFPQTEEIKIPFQYDPQVGRFAVIQVLQVKSLNISTDLDRALDDTDNPPDHKLRPSTRTNTTGFDAPTLVHVIEAPAPTKGIQFTDICRSSTGVINGNVRVLVAIGQPNSRDSGFMRIRFKTKFSNNIPGNTQ